MQNIRAQPASLHVLVGVGFEHGRRRLRVQEELSDVLDVVGGDDTVPGNLGRNGRWSQKLHRESGI